jgi:hypothetical protein
MIIENGGMIDRGNQRTWRKTYPSTTLSTTNPTWIDPGANPGLCCEKPATSSIRISPGDTEENYEKSGIEGYGQNSTASR